MRSLTGLREWVALDLETTGLSSDADDIIEIGAVKFTARGVVDEFHSLVNSRRQLSAFIRQLTGISQSEVDSAPSFSQVSSSVTEFLSGATLVAHNAGFDVGFLRAKGLDIYQPVCDTWELAYLARPVAPSYALDQLARSERVKSPRFHRALDDARVVRSVFLKLISDLSEFDPALVAELRRLSQRSGWSIGPLLDSAEEFTGEDSPRRLSGSPGGISSAALAKKLAQPRALRPAEKTQDIDSRVVEKSLLSGGPFSEVMTDFQERPQQVEMALAVAETINSGGRLIVEAGTGVGKSLAYLLPAALYGTANDKRVVVSTNTINLQEQLIHKDLPIVKEAMRGFAPEASDAFRFTLLKGRANYLCYRRWRQMRSSADLDEAQARLVAKALLWMPTTETGDRSELNLGHWKAASVWDRFSAGYHNRCPATSAPCFLRAAREKSEAAHVVVVNHALLISDLVAGNTAIPSYDILIIDEAHQLENVATDQLGFEVSARDVDDLVGELAGERGLLNRCGMAVQRIDVAQSRRESIEQATSMALPLIPRLREAAAELSLSVSAAVFPRKPQSSGFDPEKRITEDVRSSPSWRTVERSWENLDIVLGNLNRAVSALVAALEGIDSEGVADVEALMSDLASVGERIGTLRSRTGELVSNPSDDYVYWVRQSASSSDVFLKAAPLHVGQLLEDALYSNQRTIVATSATLSASGSFEHTIERLGLTESRTLALGSPFDFYESALIHVPRGFPPPNSAEFQPQVEAVVSEAAAAVDGRTMVLFTSRAALRATSSAIRAAMSARGIQVLAQGIDGSPARLASRFLNEPRSVLLGTSSFWEGVDFVGDTLSVLILARLPFSVPTEPVFEARSEQYENPFMEYALPEAILRFRQGFGRLIRSDKDRGVAIVLDSRIATRRYGREFLTSLPEMRVTDGKGAGAGEVITKWLEYAG